MVGYISDYRYKYQMFVLSKSPESTLMLRNKDIVVGELSNNFLHIIPDNIMVKLTDSEFSRMSELSDYDIIEIDDRGIYYQLYSRKEDEAGVVTTPRCNSNCVMCPASESSRQGCSDTPVDRLLQYVRYLPDDVSFITITGGEPTLIGTDHFSLLLKAIAEKYSHTGVLLLTNGRTLGSSAFFERFSQCVPADFRVAIPIHGSNAEKHDAVTQVRGSFAQTMCGIQNLLSKSIKVEIRIVVSKLNCDDLSDIADLILRRFPGVSVVNFIGLEMRGNCAKNSERVIIPYEMAFQKSKLAIRQLAIAGIDVGLYNFPYCMIDKEYWYIAKKSIAGYKSKFYDKCDSCRLRNDCCGIFEATMKFYHPEVYPVS